MPTTTRSKRKGKPVNPNQQPVPAPRLVQTKGNPGARKPPQYPPPTRRKKVNPVARKPPQYPPPTRRKKVNPGPVPAPRRPPVAAPTGNDMFTDGDRQKLDKLNTYKTQCENLAELYKYKHNNEIIPLVNYIRQIREQTPDKKIGELNIPKFIASLRKIDIPDFNQTELNQKVQEQKQMMINSQNKVEKIRRKLTALKGETLPEEVLKPNPGVVVPETVPVNKPGIGTRLKNFAKRATRRFTKKKPGPVGKGAKGGYKNTKKRKKKL